MCSGSLFLNVMISNIEPLVSTASMSVIGARSRSCAMKSRG